MLSEREYAARDGFNAVQEEMQAWLEEIEAERVDVHYDGVGLLGRIRFWLTENAVKRLLDEPDEDSYDAIVVLRKVQAVPGRGAWFWSHLWMEMPEGVLHQESDWMREPDLDVDEEPDLYHYKAELNHYPRDEKNIPDWLRKKVAQWEVERGSAFNRRIAELEEDFYVLTHGPRGSQAEREAVRTGRLPRMRGGAEFDLARERVLAWLGDSGAERIDVYIKGLGSSQRIRYWLTADGKKESARADGGVAKAVARALLGRSPQTPAREVLTPVLEDPPSLVPFVVALAPVLARPAAVRRMAARTVADYSITPEAVARVSTR